MDIRQDVVGWGPSFLFKGLMLMKISSGFDGGNIRCLGIENEQDIQLEILKDNGSDFYQWFYFRLTGAKGRDCRLKIMNAKDAAYAGGYQNYRAAASYDRETWFRVETEFDGSVLTIKHQPEENGIYFAYFAPYSMERHADLIAEALNSPNADLVHLGQTLDSQDLDLLQIGEWSEGKKRMWVIARQHPGEIMAEWWMEGFLERLLDEDDPISREVLNKACFYVVPNMNPDGSRRGHLRTNAVGSNLNREWQEPSLEKSPEVFYVREMMESTGVDFFLDVHGDEELPYNFISGPEGTPNWDKARQTRLDDYIDDLMRVSPDFQKEHGYPVDDPGTADLRIATNWVSERFNCLGMTLEMPFKDTVETPDLIEGWSPERSRKLGAANLNAMWEFLKRG